MSAPKEVIRYVGSTGSHVLAEQTWLAARETLAIQLYQQNTVDIPYSSWVLLPRERRDAYRLEAQNVMYGEF